MGAVSLAPPGREDMMGCLAQRREECPCQREARRRREEGGEQGEGSREGGEGSTKLAEFIRSLFPSNLNLRHMGRNKGRWGTTIS